MFVCWFGNTTKLESSGKIKKGLQYICSLNETTCMVSKTIRKYENKYEIMKISEISICSLGQDTCSLRQTAYAVYTKLHVVSHKLHIKICSLDQTT